MTVLIKLLSAISKAGVKCNPDRCDLYTESVKWTGHIISPDGVSYDDSFIHALLEVSEPVRADELQQFVCGLNWIRSNIPHFNELISPLQDLLLQATRTASSCKKTSLHRIKLHDIGWTSLHAQSFLKIKEIVANLVRLSHPKDHWLACLFPDTSQNFWSVVLTQIPPEDCDLPLTEQRHELLACLSGTFRANSLRWAIIEKEGYPIIEGIYRLRHFLIRSTPIRIFTDHRNLMYIFNPLKRSANVVEHIEGDQNVWADLFTRWGVSSTSIAAQLKALKAP